MPPFPKGGGGPMTKALGHSSGTNINQSVPDTTWPNAKINTGQYFPEWWNPSTWAGPISKWFPNRPTDWNNQTPKRGPFPPGYFPGGPTILGIPTQTPGAPSIPGAPEASGTTITIGKSDDPRRQMQAAFWYDQSENKRTLKQQISFLRTRLTNRAIRHRIRPVNGRGTMARRSRRPVSSRRYRNPKVGQRNRRGEILVRKGRSKRRKSRKRTPGRRRGRITGVPGR